MPRGRGRILSIDARRFRRAVGARLRAAREQLGWSQLRLALTVGVGQATLSGWESGARAMRVEALALAASALGVRVVDLLPEAA